MSTIDPMNDPEINQSPAATDGRRGMAAVLRDTWRMLRPEPVLDVVTSVFNPYGNQRRYELYADFKAHMQEAGVRLTTVELALKGQPFVVTDATCDRDIQVRGEDVLFAKENLLNLGIGSLPRDSKYVAWVDCDITFHNPNWVRETIARLRKYHFVQMYEWAYDLGPEGEQVSTFRSFAAQQDNPIPWQRTWSPYGGWSDVDCGGRIRVSDWKQPGLAWAARRSSIVRVGGLFDCAIVGSADLIMARSLVGGVLEAFHPESTRGYREAVSSWQERARKRLKGDRLGFVPGKVSHHWHGDRRNRGYRDREGILVDFHFDPFTDLYVNGDGVYHLVDRGMKQAIRDYFDSRDDARLEDGAPIQ